MTEILTALFENTLEITLSMSVMISLVLVFSLMYSSKFRAGCRYMVWILIAARLLIPINLHYSEPLIHIDEGPEPVMQQGDLITDKLSNIVTINPSDSAGNPNTDRPGNNGSSGTSDYPADSKPDIKPIAAAVWITAAVLSFMYTVGGYLKLQYNLRRWSRPASEHVFDMLEIKRAEYKINKILRVYVSEVASSPMLCGFFRPTIVLPPTELDDERLDAALTHELVHLRRRDLWIKLLLCAAQSLHWFNPLVHIMCRSAAQDIEFSCDEEVLEGCGDRERRIYADALLIFIKSERAHKLPLTTQFDTRRKPIIRRFDRILSETPRLPGTLLVIIAAFLIVISASFIEIGGTRDLAELPDDRYFMLNGIIYSTADDTPRGNVTAAYEYRRRRFVPLERINRRITSETGSGSAEYGYSYYVSSSGKVIKASNNVSSVNGHITYPPAVSSEPTLYAVTEENQVMTYLSDGTLNAYHIAKEVSITTPDAVFIDGEIKIHCKPLSYSPDGSRMLYLAGCRSYSSLYLYDFDSSSSVMIYPDLTSYVIPDSYNTGRFCFMDEKRVLVMPFAPEGRTHKGFVYDIDSKKTTPLETYANLEADRYRFVYGTPYMLHLYDGNIMLNNTRTAVYLDPAVPISLSRNIAYCGSAPSERYIWFADTDCAHMFRVLTDG
nr:M56 family metallopeptidase [Clostridia bacterium]